MHLNLILVFLFLLHGVPAQKERPKLRRLLLNNFDLNPFRKDTAVVTLTNGQIMGTSDGKSDAFMGVPFARPPIAHRRFMKPESIKDVRWSGVRKTKMTGPMCVQRAALFTSSPIVGNEDCLYLNVYRPSSAVPGAKLPVLVFIPGGAYSIGSSYWLDGQYDGSVLAYEQNVIVVVLSYRLHLFGFLATEQLEYANGGTVGNLALQDQQEGLRWVKREIANFGGDRDHVLLFGESAGGFSVVWHAVNKFSQRENLFTSAITQSATSDLSWFFQSKEDAFQLYSAFVEYLGCPSGEPNQLGCLQEIPAPFLIEAWARWSDMILASNDGHGKQEHHPGYVPMLHLVCSFGPVIDGSEEGLIEAPYQLIKKGEFHRVPLVSGITRDEGSVFSLIIPAIVDSSQRSLTVEQWMEIAELIVQSPEAIQQLYLLYPLRRVEGLWAAQEWAQEIIRDFVFGCATEEMVADWGQYAPSYLFLFSGTMGYLGQLSGMGSMHSFDLHYIFKSFPPGSTFIMSPRETQVANEMGARWAAMARTGNPNAVEFGRTPWPEFKDAAQALEFAPKQSADVSSQLFNVREADSKTWPKAEKCDYWRSLRPLPWINHREEPGLANKAEAEAYIAKVIEKLGLIDAVPNHDLLHECHAE